MLHFEYHTYHYRRCENGHMVYSAGGPVAEGFCSVCGAAFLVECPQCSTPLPSSFQSTAYTLTGEPVNVPSRPGACGKCGKVFPWTLRDAFHAEMTDIEAVAITVRICERFHEVVKQLRSRRDGRGTLDIADEYDVQDLVHALLKIHFDDIRAEEWTPSYAGGSARVDFLIRPYMTLIEVKKARPGMTAKVVGNQLIEDIARYRQIQGVKALVCLVYDPEERIVNPKGLITDLEGLDKSVDLRVVICPTM